MKPFMDKDFLLSNETARRLFHETAAAQPIYDYHCHLDPQQLHSFESKYTRKAQFSNKLAAVRRPMTWKELVMKAAKEECGSDCS